MGEEEALKVNRSLHHPTIRDKDERAQEKERITEK